ncbi:MAG: rod shape-determining protein [Clostridia bacterium]|nr:rod shape-determining protein [Clostridia bacterium]
MGFNDWLARDLSIDLGTANVLVFARGRGIVVREPTVVAVKKQGGSRSIVKVGHEAKRMIGRTASSISAVRPLQNGVIADIDVTEAMLEHFIKKAVKRLGPIGKKPRVVVCAPCGITEVEKRAVEKAAHAAGASQAHILEEPMAAAIGAMLPVLEPQGSMIVDIGGGTSEVAVISYGDIVVANSLRVGGNRLDEAIVQYFRRERNLAIGERTAEEIKINIGSAFRGMSQGEMEVRGRDLITGMPISMTITGGEVFAALSEPVSQIIEMIKTTLEDTPPELSADIMQFGITMTGGGALLTGLNKLIAQETGVEVRIAESPMECVVMGSARYWDQLYQKGN